MAITPKEQQRLAGLLTGNAVTSSVQPGATVLPAQPSVPVRAQRLPQSTTGLFSGTQAPVEDFSVTDELLTQHWRDNPAALEQAIARNPAAFGVASTPNLKQQFTDINTRYDDIFANANQTASDLLPTFSVGADGKVNNPENTLSAFDAIQNFNPTGDYRKELNTALEASGTPPVIEKDGQLYAISTGKENGFTNLTFVPAGYEFAEDVAPGEYGKIRVPAKENWSIGLIKDIVQSAPTIIGGAVGGPVGASLGSALGSVGRREDVGNILEDAAKAYVGSSMQGVDGLGSTVDVANIVSALNRPSANASPVDAVYNPNVEQQAPNIVTDIIGPGGMFDLSVLDRPAAPRPTVPQPVEPTETTTTDGGGGGGTTADTAAEAPPVNETPVVEDVFGDITEEERRESMKGGIIGTINDAGDMVLWDGRVVSAPPGNWQPGDLVPEHSEDTTSDVPFDLTGLESVFDTTGDLEDIAEPTTPATPVDPATGTTGDIVDAIGDILGGTTGAAVVGGIIGDLLDGSGSGGGTGSGTGTGSGDGNGDGTGDGTGTGLGSGATRLANAIKFEPFMASIDFFVPLLQRLNIPVRDFLAELIANKDKK